MPKATASTSVQQLEEQLGVRLLHRTTRQVSLTQDGQSFIERARALLDDFDELTSYFHEGKQSTQGRIRVDMPLGVATQVVVPRLPEFLAKNPALEVELSSTDRIVDVVEEGYDLVLRVGSLGDSSLMARTLGHYEVVNCASPRYLKRYGVPKTPEDLHRDRGKHRMVHYASRWGRPPDGFEYLDPETGEVHEMPMLGALAVNNSRTYLEACRAGLGIIQAPKIGSKHDLDRGTLVEILPRYRARLLPVSLLYPHRRHQARRVRAFMEWLIDGMKPYLLP